MKKLFLSALVASALLCGQNGFAADGTNAVITDLNALITRVNAKIHLGLTSEKSLADEFKGFDDLYAKYKDLKTEDAAQIMMMKTAVYLDVLGDYDKDYIKAAEALQQIKRDMPDTPSGKRADSILQDLKKPIEQQQIRDKLTEGATFPDFNEKDLSGKPLSIAGIKGKVVMVDFWATWCPPCVAEMPNVQKIYAKYHAQGFEVIGVSLDVDRTALDKFVKGNNIPWPQFFDSAKWGDKLDANSAVNLDEEKWNNKLAVKYGVNLAPTTYLLDGNGKIIAMNLRSDELEAAVAKALGK